METKTDRIIELIEDQAYEQFNGFAREQLLIVVEKIKEMEEPSALSNSQYRDELKEPDKRMSAVEILQKFSGIPDFLEMPKKGVISYENALKAIEYVSQGENKAEISAEAVKLLGTDKPDKTEIYFSPSHKMVAIYINDEWKIYRSGAEKENEGRGENGHICTFCGK